MKKKILCVIAVLILSAAALTGCTEADKVNKNLNKQARRNCHETQHSPLKRNR